MSYGRLRGGWSPTISLHPSLWWCTLPALSTSSTCHLALMVHSLSTPSAADVVSMLPSSQFGLKYHTSFRQTPSVSLCVCVLSSEDMGGKAGRCAHSAGFVLHCIYIARRTAVQLVIKWLSWRIHHPVIRNIFVSAREKSKFINQSTLVEFIFFFFFNFNLKCLIITSARLSKVTTFTWFLIFLVLFIRKQSYLKRTTNSQIQQLNEYLWLNCYHCYPGDGQVVLGSIPQSLCDSLRSAWLLSGGSGFLLQFKSTRVG